MESDFYLADRRSLATYFEKEWFDHVLAQTTPPSSAFESAAFAPEFLYCDSHEKVATFLTDTMRTVSIAPQTLLDVGCALGRGFFEIQRRCRSLHTATLIEPSQSLASTVKSLFGNGPTGSYPMLRGHADIVEVAFDTTHIQRAVRGVRLSLINKPHAQLPDDLGMFDLVTCFNVLDQCEEPLMLMERLKQHTASGGVLALSCTYQWSKKNLGTPSERAAKLLQPAPPPTQNINEVFGSEWTRLNETDIAFKIRKSERHWWVFLSRVSVFQRAAKPPMEQVLFADIRNFREAEERLFTSGQPSEAQLAAAASAGVQVVINLALHDDSRYSLPDEKRSVESLGMEYVHIPVSFASPTEADLLAFFRAMDAAQGSRTLVHCAANYRVTAFVGLYRRIRQGWSHEDAFSLMRTVWEPNEVWTEFMRSMLEKHGVKA